MMKWVIYVLKCPRTQAVRYVGWTKRTPQQRLTCHISEAQKNRNTYKNKWVMSLISIGLRPLIEVIDSGEGDGWGDREIEWIARYRAIGAKLTNGTIGGEGVVGWGTPELRRQHSINTAAKFTKEQHRERGLATAAKFTPEQRSEVARKRQAAKTPEEKSANSKKIWSNMSEEKRQAVIKKMSAGQDPEKMKEGARKRNLSVSSERRREAGIKGNAKLTPEQRSERGRKSAEAKDPEERRRVARLAWANTTPEERSARAIKRQQAKTPESRALTAKKAWETKRQRYGSSGMRRQADTSSMEFSWGAEFTSEPMMPMTVQLPLPLEMARS